MCFYDCMVVWRDDDFGVREDFWFFQKTSIAISKFVDDIGRAFRTCSEKLHSDLLRLNHPLVEISGLHCCFKHPLRMLLINDTLLSCICKNNQ